ncbi:hypothetical protein MNBD_GAMMA21-24 [hydrothermal vent metagenome]|uniref:Cytochrome c domain-containing protein n=1 Tax=hydrothermal vent metagenome TaxID=652676 RepID=A0A3B0ZR67_9ZZZZ
MKITSNLKLASLPLTIFFTFGMVTAVPAADVSKLVKEECADCHEKTGNSTDGKTPSIAGISVDYFVESMEEYKNGARPALKLKDKDEDMKEVAKELSDEDIAALADYFAGQKYIPQKQNFDPGMAKVGKKLHRKYCDKCHTEGGSSAEDDAGILAGQPISYLKYSMDNYAQGKREMGKKMTKKFKKMQKKAGDEGIEQLIHYYASQQ